MLSCLFRALSGSRGRGRRPKAQQAHSHHIPENQSPCSLCNPSLSLEGAVRTAIGLPGSIFLSCTVATTSSDAERVGGRLWQPSSCVTLRSHASTLCSIMIASNLAFYFPRILAELFSTALKMWHSSKRASIDRIPFLFLPETQACLISHGLRGRPREQNS